MFENGISVAVLPASDIERALRFWHDVFGLDPVNTDMGGAAFMVGSSAVLVYPSEFAGTNKATALSIMSDDLDRDMAELREKGVTFLEYDFPGLTTVDGVADMDGDRGAWFEDSEGNIIAIAEPIKMSMDEARAMLSAAAG
ncbi:VOC family protein [Agromyces sp. SYSU T0242]|uniref:VOC family protein n=1 Tax=Agromyces litoreus TaxID=3158561 RepID=UPI003390A068